jgi:uncharacterized protein (PEP-CTERM system associated)
MRWLCGRGVFALCRGLVAGCCAVLAFMLVATGAANAQQAQLEPSMDARVVLTDNVGFNRPELAQRDAIFNLYSQLRVDSRGPWHQLAGTFGMLAVKSVETAAPKHLLPRVQLDLNTEVVERTFFVDANAGVVSTREDPFGARSDPSITYDALGSLEYHFGLHPRLQRDLSPELKVLLRSDVTWIRTDSSSTATVTQPDVRYQDSAFRLDRKAVPLGFNLELRRQKELNDTVHEVGAVIDSIRATGTYAFGPGLTAGATLGQEHNIYSSSDDVDPIRGVSLEWQPGERTEFRGKYERRFFGNGWEVALRHRTPFMAFALTTARQPILASTILGLVPPGGDVVALLDAILSSRYPNPSERAGIVSGIVASQGLPASTNQPLEIRSQSAQLVQTTNASIGLLGRRTSVFLSGFGSKSQALARANLQAISLNTGSVNQKGLSLQASHRLSPKATLNAVLSLTDTKGLRDTGEREDSRDRSVMLSWINATSPRSNVHLGIVKHALRTDSQIVPSASELRSFAGLSHRF